MLELDIDFHIHSKYSKGVSKNMELGVIATQAELKGLDVVGTGDALCLLWLNHIKQSLSEEGEGIYRVKGSDTKFLITSEVEDDHRVHHLLLFPSISSAEGFRERMKPYSSDLDREGRPHVRLNGEALVDHANSVGAVIGPAHAFTPWTAVYKEYDSLTACYGENRMYIHFLELGLSADTSMADRIKELEDLTFMSNSDTHSPWPQRLGREFNRVELRDLSFGSISDSFVRRNGNRFLLNVGLDPREGKYHLTSCTKCFLRFKLADAEAVKWRCPECRGIIKKGVDDRINELATWPEPHHPGHRPRYVHIIPLAEVIALASGKKTLTGKGVTERWSKLVNKFNTEINVLIDADLEDIKRFDPEVGKVIEAFRADRIRYIAGGGGQYGRPTLGDERDNYYGRGQKKLNEF